MLDEKVIYFFFILLESLAPKVSVQIKFHPDSFSLWPLV